MEIIVNSITLHYEIKGIGNPVLFLHGNDENLHIFDVLTDSLKDQFTCYCIDSRNHGNSSQTDLYSYDVMTEDISQFIKQLNLQEVTIVGFSDGAILALLLAIKHPTLISKMVLAGVNISPKAFIPKIYRDIQDEYNKSKDPLLYMMLTQPNIERSDLEKIQTPSLLIYGENDVFTNESFEEIRLSLPNCKTLEMKGHSHDSYIVNKAILAPIISDFLS